jgi:hypothetical protein
MLALLSLVTVLSLSAAGQAAGQDPAGSAPQIAWQRSLDDALAVAAAEGRKILVAINADGESASERIVRERYRDPAFVASTRPFVCVVGSVFRHTPRDVDAEGRRVLCPRLGAITCGEHIAMEPRVFERFQAGAEILLDGEVVERISPRHTLASPQGQVDWDLFLLFDLGELDDQLAGSAALALPAARWESAFTAPMSADPGARRAQLRAAAADRSNAGRTFFEELLDRAGPLRWEMTDAVLHAGDAGSVSALRVMAKWQLPVGRLAYVARVLGVSPELAVEVRDAIQAHGAFLGRGLVGEIDSPRWLLDTLTDLDPEGSRTLAASHAVMPVARLLEILEAAADTRPASAPVPPPDERPSAAEYEVQLESLEAQLEARPTDAGVRLQLGRALLGLARRRIEVGDGSAGFLLEDATRELSRAADSFPNDVTLQLDLARAAFYRSDFESEERHAQRALAQPGLDLDTRTEAQRWLGDAGARLLTQRANGAPDEERAALLRTFEALAAAALSAESDATDWVSFASFCGATGRPYAQQVVGWEGLARFPESNELRGVFTAALRWLAAPPRLYAAYRDVARQHDTSGASAWYAGWAAVNAAEWGRRREDPERALGAYKTAANHFRRASELRPDYVDTCEHYLAMCALGGGFAHLLADRREEAARALVEAIGLRPAIATQRDGLEREALDLIDGALEWRWSGASPVDPSALASELSAVDPESSFWARAIADAELREGLRAYGRDEPEEGMRYLRLSLELARQGLALEDDEKNRALVAQSATVIAEALLDGGEELAEVRELLAEAFELMARDGGLGEHEAPAAETSADELRALRDRLRELLGAARPAFRPGR